MADPNLATNAVDARAESPQTMMPSAIIMLGTVALLTFVLSANLLPRVHEVSEGDVANVTIRAPRKASYVSAIRTRTAREQAVSQVAPIIELDYDLIAQQRRALAEQLQAITAARQSQGRVEQRQEAIRQTALPPLSDETARRIAEMNDPTWSAVEAESRRLLADVLKDRLPEESLEEVSNTLPLRVSPVLPEADRSVVVDLTRRYLRPNLVVNEEATARARRAAQEAVAPVVVIFERGQTIVREGQVIGPLELEALEAMNLRNPTADWQSVAGSALISTVLVGMLAAYMWLFDRPLMFRTRRIALLALVVIVGAVAAKMIIPGRPLWVYLFPTAAATMLIATLLGARLAIMLGAVLSVVVAWIAGMSLETATLSFVGGTVGALAVWRKERMHSFVLAAFYVVAAQLIVFMAFFLGSRSDDWPSVPIVAFELLVSGMLSALLALGSVAFAGRVFGILTTLQLLELANPTQPLLRRLLMEAPGTYHHSIMVGNLAERAAELIGADSLLVRVAAYYHDIGKLERPWAFIENLSDTSENVHDSLEPVESAQIIAAHVTDGVRLAIKYGLPPRIREIIPQHHGTRPISFFYQQAAERTDASIDPTLFTYPGPRPQSREAAILMLADSTEAAARASRDHSREAIEELVERIVRHRLEEGQFDDCDLTLRDLTMIKDSFVTLLTGIYHPRIAYPPATTAAGSASSDDVLGAGARVRTTTDVSV